MDIAVKGLETGDRRIEDSAAMLERLLLVLEKSASKDAMIWLREELAQTQSGEFDPRSFYFSFSGVSRRFDRRNLVSVSEEEARVFDSHSNGFVVDGWDEFRLARVCLLIALAERPPEILKETVSVLLNTADFREQVAIFSAFPLFDEGEAFVEYAREGLRSNIVDVFDAIAIENPFPAREFEDDAWNQLVLKALFMSRPLYKIHGIDNRANLKLAETLSDLAHERWAAGRWVSPELWRSCAPFISEQIAEDIIRVANTDEPGQREAAALVIAGDETRRTDPARDVVRTFLDDVENGSLTWQSLGESL